MVNLVYSSSLREQEKLPYSETASKVGKTAYRWRFQNWVLT
jgi:hypothetical protein